MCTHCSGVRSETRTNRMPAFSSWGMIERERQEYCRSTKSRILWSSIGSSSCGVKPEAYTLWLPDSAASMTPATRTIINSSRFEAVIARNRIRSISGFSFS